MTPWDGLSQGGHGGHLFHLEAEGKLTLVCSQGVFLPFSNISQRESFICRGGSQGSCLPPSQCCFSGLVLSSSRDKRAEGAGLWEPAQRDVFVGAEHGHFVLSSAKLARRRSGVCKSFLAISAAVSCLLPVPQLPGPGWVLGADPAALHSGTGAAHASTARTEQGWQKHSPEPSNFPAAG